MVYRTKNFLSDYIIDIRDEPAQPGSAVTLLDALLLISQSVRKVQNLKFDTMRVLVLKFVAS